MKVSCPHCGRKLGGGNLSRHMDKCARNPAHYERIHAAMASPDHPGYALPQKEYDALSNARGAPCVRSLEKQFGDWTAACEFFSLLSISAQRDVDEAAAIAEVAAAVEAAALHAKAMDRGLEVCAVRQLPDGRVAYVLR